MKKRHAYKYLAVFMLLIFVLGSGLLLLPRKVHAFPGSVFPNASTQPGSVADVGINGPNSDLTAPYSTFEIATSLGGNAVEYIPIKITIVNACKLRENPSTRHMEMWVNNYISTDPTDRDPGTPVQNNYGPDCIGDDIVFNNVKAYLDGISYNGSIATARVTVHKIGQGHGLFFVKAESPGKQVHVSYVSDPYRASPSFGVATPHAFALWANPKAHFQFTPSCDYQDNSPIYLKWQDADVGEWDQPDPRINWVLYDHTAGRTVYAMGGYSLGGQGTKGHSPALRLQKGHLYTWDWDFIDGRNALQLLMPFSENATLIKQTCNRPPTGNLTLKCPTVASTSTYKVTGSDPDHPDKYSNFRIMNSSADPGSSGNVLFADDNIKAGISHSGVENPGKKFTGGHTYRLEIQDDAGSWVQVDTAKYPSSCPPPISGNASVATTCTWTSVNDAGNYNVTIRNGNYPGYGNVGSANNNFKTRSHVWISGVDQPVSNALIPFGSIKSHTWLYVPIKPDIGIVIAQRAVNPKYPNDASRDFDWIGVNGNPDIYRMNRFEVRHCYVPSCQITATGDGPGGIVIKGGAVHVTGYITNNLSAEAAMPDSINGGHLSFTIDNPDGSATPHNTPGGVWPGATAQVGPFDVPANGSVSYQTIIAQTDYWWSAGRMGEKCPITFPVYEEFDLQPTPNGSLEPDEENPSTFKYTNTVRNTASVAVPVTITNCAYKMPADCGPGQIAYSQQPSAPPGNFTSLNGISPVSLPIIAGKSYCTNVFVSNSHGFVGPSGTPPIYTSGELKPFPSCPTITNKPYFKVLGANVRAGGVFAEGGMCNGGGTLASWYRHFGTDNYGADVQLSTIATVAITGLASGAGSTHTPTGLSFANSNVTSSSSSPILGGEYSSCHYIKGEDAPDTANPEAGTTGTVGTALLSDRAHTYNGDLTLNGGEIAAGKNLAIFAKGNIRITGDIKYNTGGWSLNSNNVPSFVLKAGGNIYIDPGVTRLDGLYVAQSNDSANKKGIIYTCSNGSGFGPMPVGGMYSGCNKRLTVYGSFRARQINLMRTYGSLRNAKPSNTVCSNDGGVAQDRNPDNCAAEVFRFSPEMYLSNPAVKPPSNGATRFDAYTSLPPVL